MSDFIKVYIRCAEFCKEAKADPAVKENRSEK